MRSGWEGSPSVPEHLDRAVDALARDTSRRGFLARVGSALLGLTAARTVGTLIEPGDTAEAWFGFCGHTFTTGWCPHPTGLPRIDSRGFPLRASDGQPIDNLGRPVNADDQPVDSDGQLLRDADGRPLAPAPRTPICNRAGELYGFSPHIDGSWYRCCGGKVRQLRDCCAHKNTRINGDAALTGYCYSGRKVFCVQYYDTRVPC
jgi:hypothetical protein